MTIYTQKCDNHKIVKNLSNIDSTPSRSSMTAIFKGFLNHVENFTSTLFEEYASNILILRTFRNEESIRRSIRSMYADFNFRRVMNARGIRGTSFVQRLERYGRRERMVKTHTYTQRKRKRERERGWKVDSRVESFYTRLKKTIPPIRAPSAEHTASNLKAKGAKDALRRGATCRFHARNFHCRRTPLSTTLFRSLLGIFRLSFAIFSFFFFSIFVRRAKHRDAC